MAAASGEISPMEEEATLLVTLKDMWFRILEFIVKMTSGVVYSIVMHSIIITAYVLLFFQIFYTNEIDLDLIHQVCGLCLFYIIFMGLEVAARCFCEEPMAFTIAAKGGHWCGTLTVTTSIFAFNPNASTLLFFLGVSLRCWFFFLLVASMFISPWEDRSLTTPLV